MVAPYGDPIRHKLEHQVVALFCVTLVVPAISTMPGIPRRRCVPCTTAGPALKWRAANPMSTQVSPIHGVDYTALTNFMQSAFDTSKALLESTEAQKAAILVSFGNSIRQIDDLLIQVAGVPDPAVRADLRSRLQAVRASVVHYLHPPSRRSIPLDAGNAGIATSIRCLFRLGRITRIPERRRVRRLPTGTECRRLRHPLNS